MRRDFNRILALISNPRRVLSTTTPVDRKGQVSADPTYDYPRAVMPLEIVESVRLLAGVLAETKKAIFSTAVSYKATKDNCPLDYLDNVDHDDLALMISGDRGDDAYCPFCGHRVG